MTSLLVTWGRHRFHVDFTGYEGAEHGFSGVTLGMLKERCRDVTGVPVNAMKLLYSGGELKRGRGKEKKMWVYLEFGGDSRFDMDITRL